MYKKEEGFAAIVSVLLIASVLLAITVTETLTSVGEIQSSLSTYQGETTQNLVDGCVEDALLFTRNSSAYNGGTVTRPEGTCQITVSKVGNTWTITVAPVGTKHNRSIEVIVNRTNAVNLTSWRAL